MDIREVPIHSGAIYEGPPQRGSPRNRLRATTPSQSNLEDIAITRRPRRRLTRRLEDIAYSLELWCAALRHQTFLTSAISGTGKKNTDSVRQEIFASWFSRALSLVDTDTCLARPHSCSSAWSPSLHRVTSFSRSPT